MIQIEQITKADIEAGRSLIEGVLRKGRVGEAELALLREHFAELGAINRTEAEALFAIDREAQEKAADWTTFFVATITDYVVWQSRPTGVVNGVQGEWLLAQADQNRTIEAFAILVNVLAEADRVPAWLPAAVHGRAAAWPAVAGALRFAEAA
jgi:hypothetical protein